MKGSGHTNGLLHRELPKPSKELVGVKSHDELLRLLMARQQEVVSGAGTDPAADLRRQEEEGALSPKSLYQKNKVAREQLSLQLLMHLNGEQMASIKAEFHAHDDEVDLEDFCAIMERHKPENLMVDRGGSGSENSDSRTDSGSARRGDETGVNDGGSGGGGGGAGAGAVAGAGKVVVSRQEVISNLVELFKEVDINGDGMMEWDEFTRFVVVKAQLHHAQMSIDQLAEYRQGLKQVEVASYNRSCGAVEQLCYIPGSHQVAAIQEHNPIVNLYNSHTWTRVAQLKHNAVPLAMAYCGNHHTLVTASADMTLLQWHLDDIPAIKHFTLKSRWPTKHAAMSMCWSSSHRLLYSGTTAGTIQGWDIGERQEMVTLKGHSDIVMGMMVMRSLDNLVSASLDTSIRVWDTYTQKPVHTLLGHNKGVHSLTYSSQYRCLISAGFDHEAHVWSPFVNSLLNKLKGHHASLVGCQAVEGTPELITADSSGVVKLWDLRTFHCVQTFQTDNDGELPRDKASTSCFVHFKVPPTRSNQEQDDHRLVLARGKRLLPFDQYRCKTEAITDDFVVTCACFNHTSLTILTATERTVKIWDAVGGILKGVFKGITDADITAVCLDDRERKFILGNARGEVAVYNFRNGAKMKDLDTQAGPIAGLVYCEQEKAVLVACQDGDMVCFDEMDPDKAALLVTFEGGGSAYSDDLNNVAYSHKNGLVATSSCNPEDGIIIWGFGTGRQDHVLAHGKAEGLVSSVAALLFLDPYPLLLATYADGAIRVWGVRGSPLKGLLVLTFPNQAPKEAYFWGDEDAEYPLLRYKPTAEELAAAAEKTHLTADGDRKTGQASTEIDTATTEAPGATEQQPTTENAEVVSSVKGQSSGRKKSRGNADTGRLTERQAEEDGEEKEDDEHKFSEWKVHPRWTPRKDTALQVLSTQWHSATASLFTGDETGRLRCWNLQRVLEALGVDPVREVAVGYADSYRGGNRTQGGMGASRGSDGVENKNEKTHGTRKGSTLQRMGSATTLAVKQVSSDMVDFRWGAEGAHEDAIGLVVLVPTDPPALLTSGGDRCVKAWTLDGRPQGMLLQGLAPHAPNPRWSFSVNVEAMAHAEVSETKTVLARIDERRASKMAAAAQAAADEGAMFPDPVPQRHRSDHNHHHHHHQQRRKRRTSGSGSLPSAETSPLKQAQLLRQRKESTAAAAAQGVVEKTSNGGRNDSGGLAVPEAGETGRHGGGRSEDDRDGGGGIGGSGFQGNARSMALEAASEGLGNFSRSSCSSDGTSCSTSSRSFGGRYTDRPSVVPPSPGRRRGGPGAGVSSIVERMGKASSLSPPFPTDATETTEQLLDEAETFSDAHTNRFGGRRSNVSDFIKGADNGSIKSGSSGTRLGPGILDPRGQR